MKRMIVIILVLILVAGAGGGGLIMLGIVPNPFNPKVPERPLTAAEKAAAELEKKNKFVPPQSEYKLVKMGDMVVPVIIDGRAERRVMLIARLMATSNDDVKFIEAGLTRYQDVLLNDLVPHFQTYFVKHDMIDILDIKARLMKHAKTVFGEHVKDVLLVNAFEQNNSRNK
jgi:hypothetical protein